MRHARLASASVHQADVARLSILQDWQLVPVLRSHVILQLLSLCWELMHPAFPIPMASSQPLRHRTLTRRTARSCQDRVNNAHAPLARRERIPASAPPPPQRYVAAVGGSCSRSSCDALHVQLLAALRCCSAATAAAALHCGGREGSYNNRVMVHCKQVCWQSTRSSSQHLHARSAHFFGGPI